jgi:hypothetical protein
MLTSSQAYPAVSARSESRRVDALDFTKGALVCFMVVYHSLNYSAYSALAFQYFAFLPPSFIFIAGFLLTHHYLPRYKSLGWRVHKTLVLRGVKLVLLFLLLNLATKLVPGAHSNGVEGGLSSYFRSWYTIFVEGNGQHVAAFEVLLPIGYLLMLSPMLLWPQSNKCWAIPASAACLFLLCVLMEASGIGSANLELLSAGVIGTSAGLAPLEQVHSITRRWLLWIFVYAIYRFLSHFFMYTYVMQMLAVCISLSLIYAAGQYAGASGLWQREIILLGRYSLLAYIGQIAVLQVLTRFVIHRGADWTGLIGLLLLTLLITVVIIHVVDWIRRKRPLADRAYKLVFA